MNKDEVINALRALAKALPDQVDATSIGRADPRGLKRLFDESRKVLESLDAFVEALSPIKAPRFVFDPTDPTVAGELIGNALLQQTRQPLSDVEKTYGSGIYALYYLGPFDAYRPISRTDSPIYVGKADPKDPYALTPKQQGAKLFGRLNEHLRSISAAKSTLSANDFDCRFLVVKTGWQAAAEDYLINHFRPVWNNEMKVCYGFGKHGDAAKTRANTRSPWDTLHPGRGWASNEDNVPNPLGEAGIKKQIAEHYRQNPPRHSKRAYQRRESLSSE